MKSIFRSRAIPMGCVALAVALAFLAWPAGPQNDAEPPASLSLDDLFPTNRLLEVRISMSRDDWNALRFQNRTFRQAFHPDRQFKAPESPYTYFEAEATIDGVVFPRVGVRKKGFIGSQSEARPSLKLKLNYHDKDTGVDGLKTLTLNNNKQDVSQMSQLIGYRMFNDAGIPAPRSGLAKVFVNGKSLGVYSHVETVRKPLLKRGFGDSDGALFEGTVTDFHEGWEGSFEWKRGDEGAGRARIARVAKALSDGGGALLFGGPALGRGWPATSDQYDEDWTAPEFDDRSWLAGENGAGYEQNQGYENHIQPSFNFGDAMHGATSSLYLRFPFEIDDLREVQSARRLVLRMKSDDGYVAYLNGHEVARANAPEDLSWASRAVVATDDQAAVRFATRDITAHKDKLRTGTNILAIHALNISATSSDLLVVAELRLNDESFLDRIWTLIDEESFYTYWAMEGLLSFWDGYSGNRNNFFVYLNPDTDKFHFIPWGADCLFQKYSPLGVDPRSPRSARTVGLLAHKLYQIPEARAKYAARMKELLAAHWDESKLLAETRRLEALVTPHLSRHQRGWFFKPKVDFEKIRKFIRNRRPDVEREISGADMPPWSAPPEMPFIQR